MKEYKTSVKDRKYMREYMSRRLKSDKEFKQRQYKSKLKWHKRNKRLCDKLVAEFRKDGCLLCKEKEPCCLSAHHLRDKEFSIGGGEHLAISRVNAELKKCVCLCENCHRKVHAGITKLPKFMG